VVDSAFASRARILASIPASTSSGAGVATVGTGWRKTSCPRNATRRSSSFPLAEQHRLLTVGPVREELAGVGRDAVPVVGPPPFDLEVDVVDERVLLSTFAGGVEVERLLLVGLLLLGDRDRDVGLARAAPRQDHARGPVQSDLEVRLGRIERRVQDRVAQVGGRHRSQSRRRV
jgi:hypothetical protein